MVVDGDSQSLPEVREGIGSKEPRLDLDLSAAEISWLFYVIQVPDVNLGDPENPKEEPIARALLVKLARIFLPCANLNGSGIDTTKVSTTWVTSNEAWLIKHRVGIGDKFLGKDVGLSIYLKLARLIIAFDNVTTYLPTAEVGDQSYHEARQCKKS